MTIYEWTASLIGILQCALIAYGLRTMRVAGEHRNGEGERRHAEAMTALKELISRTGRARPTNQAAGLTRAKYKPNTSQIQAKYKGETGRGGSRAAALLSRQLEIHSRSS